LGHELLPSLFDDCVKCTKDVLQSCKESAHKEKKTCDVSFEQLYCSHCLGEDLKPLKKEEGKK